MGLGVLLSLGMSLLLTLLLEAGFALIFGIRDKKDMGLLILVNILTNPLVVLSYYLVINYTEVNGLIAIIVLELMAILTEGYYYRTYGKTFRHPFIFSVSINLFSFLIGQMLNLLI
ncbi:MAG: hypothetical protein K0R46_354 [Herbinix sp.]|jgi:hypothetical protein|nr:hypothetical protein [Herbinix sp.]